MFWIQAEITYHFKSVNKPNKINIINNNNNKKILIYINHLLLFNLIYKNILKLFNFDKLLSKNTDLVVNIFL